MSPPPTLPDDAALNAALAELCARDADLARAYALTGPFAVRRRPAGFAGLFRVLVGQQVSVAAADSIWRRLEGYLDPAALLATEDDALRACGLSRPKIAHARALATAIVTGALDLDAVAAAPDEEARERLVAVRGVGPWTADVYLMFALSRADVWPAGDLALRAALHELYALPERPSIEDTGRMGAGWRPYRGAAAQLLWRYYGVARGRYAGAAVGGG